MSPRAASVPRNGAGIQNVFGFVDIFRRDWLKRDAAVRSDACCVVFYIKQRLTVATCCE
jgi:hypothetical protein